MARNHQHQRNQQQDEPTSVVLCTSGYDHTIRYWDASTGTSIIFIFIVL